MTRSDIRRGYRNAGIGAAVGLGLRVALDAVLGRGPVGFSPAIVVHSAAAAMIGAAFGMLTSLARITRRKREATGTDSGTRRRIIRVVLRGKPDELSDEEQRRAARFAAIVTHSLPYEAVLWITLCAAMLLSDVAVIVWPPRGIDPARFHTEHSLFIASSAVLFVLLPAIMLRTRRRAMRWAAVHSGL